MLQIVFNEISAAEISRIPTLDQLDILTDFQVNESIVKEIDDARFGKIIRGSQTLYRFLAKDYRLYFEVDSDHVIVHRVLHKNTLSDFLFRTKLGSGSEDEALGKSKHFWSLIEEGQNAQPRS